MRDLKGWLLSIREKSRQLGEIAFQTTTMKRDEWRTLSESDPILSSAGFNSPIQLVYDEQNECMCPSTLLMGIVDPLQNDQILISFQPLHEAIHIYTALGKHEELRSTYDADRRRQMDLLLPTALNIDKNGSELRNLLANIAGFAVIERATSVKAQSFRSRTEIESLWEMMCVRVTDLVADTVSKIVDSKLLLLVKDLIELFMHTVLVSLLLLSN
jgi:exocyst complex component 6